MNRRTFVARTALLAGLVGAVAPTRAPGQGVDSARIGISRNPAAVEDSLSRLRDSLRRVGPPIKPGKALLRSIIVPGWGQVSLDRATAGALYATMEVGSLAMLIQSKHELAAAERAARDSVFDPSTNQKVANPLAARVRPRKQQVEDWAALLIFTHLLSAADAFVAAHLWDVPIEVNGDRRRLQLSTGVTW
jgi:hypothetical protein